MLETLRPELISTGLESLAYLLPVLAMAFTPKQREWFLEVYKNKCQGSAIGMKHKCGKDIHIHHVTPQMWGYAHGMTEEQVDSETNGIPLCADAHVGLRGTTDCLHPDQAAAAADYRYNKNTFAFGQLQERRGMMTQSEIPYWNQKWDSNMRKIIADRLNKFRVNGYRPFPEKRHRK